VSTAEGTVLAFVDDHVARLAPLQKEANVAYWEAATTGAPEATSRYADATAAIKRLYSSPEDSSRVKAWLASGEVSEPLLRRQLVLLHHSYTGNQLPDRTIEDLTRRAADLEQVFHTFRATLHGEAVSNNHLLDILRTERDSGARREAWEASKQVAREVSEPLRELVRRRNAAARSLGFENFYAMELSLQEIEEDHLFQLLDDFREQSDAPFRTVREEIDAALAQRFGITPEALRPWHWEDFFGQEAPTVGAVDLDSYFQEQDVVAIGAEFFRGIGLPVDDVLARSDLYERENKDQHAFCTDIDREGDVRVLCNMRANEKWMGTLLHELGHAAYDKFLPASLPYLLRGPAHTLSTEAIAMLMGRLTRNAGWLRTVLRAPLDEQGAADIARQLRASMLISTRWMLVMAYFERELYRDPDRPDLNQLWWDLVERNQFIRRPDERNEPDWAAKIHLTGAPVYYHNYLLGELMASQLEAYISQNVLEGTRESIQNAREVGEYLRDQVFARGASVDWNGLLVHATGEALQPGYFVEQFVGS
jgi:peptidyl-dipeptidase A